MKRNLIAFALAASVLGSLIPSNVYANQTNNSSSTADKKGMKTFTNKDVVYVQEDGRFIPVEITEEIKVQNYSDGYVPLDFSPKYRIRETRTYSVKVSNDDLGFPSVGVFTLGFTSKLKAAKIVSKAIAKKLGSSFLPGVNIVSGIMSAFAWYNSKTGYNGIEFKLVLKYTESYYRRDDYYMYGWNISSVSVGRY